MVLTKHYRNTRDNCCPFKSLVFCFQSTLSYIKRTSSLEAYIEWFNRLSYLVATEICLVSSQKTGFREGFARLLFSFSSASGERGGWGGGQGWRRGERARIPPMSLRFDSGT